MSRRTPVYQVFLSDTPVTGQRMNIFVPRSYVKKNWHKLVIGLHGINADDKVMVAGSTYDGALLSDGMRRTGFALAEHGYIVANTTHYDLSLAQPGSGWGNDATLTALTAAINYLQGGAGWAKTGKVALLGPSMGYDTAINYAFRNLSKVAGVVGINPIYDLNYAYLNGNATTINQAYGLSTTPNAPTLDTTVNDQRSPASLAADLLGLFPHYVYYGTADATAGTDVLNAIAFNSYVQGSGALAYAASNTDHSMWPISEQTIAEATVERVKHMAWD